jgi:hypothetical protein
MCQFYSRKADYKISTTQITTDSEQNTNNNNNNNNNNNKPAACVSTGFAFSVHTISISQPHFRHLRGQVKSDDSVCFILLHLCVGEQSAFMWAVDTECVTKLAVSKVCRKTADGRCANI